MTDKEETTEDFYLRKSKIMQACIEVAKLLNDKSFQVRDLMKVLEMVVICSIKSLHEAEKDKGRFIPMSDIVLIFCHALSSHCLEKMEVKEFSLSLKDLH